MTYCGSIQCPKCTLFANTRSKPVHFPREIPGMYKPKDRDTYVLFPELSLSEAGWMSGTGGCASPNSFPGRSSRRNISNIILPSDGRPKTPSSSWGFFYSST